MTLDLINKELGQLVRKFESMNISQRFGEIFKIFNAEDILITSSFATTSAMLLREVAIASPGQTVYFIDTRYHFEETIAYKNVIESNLDLNVVSISSSIKNYESTLKSELWKSNPNECCRINKVEPLSKIKVDYKLWISGLMKWQSDSRKQLDFIQEKDKITKCYPLLDCTYDDRIAYFNKFNLIPHPLIKEGYSSVGCKHCTIPSQDRSGRWNNNPKTECGLHL